MPKCRINLYDICHPLELGARMHYLAGPAPGAIIVKKSSPWGPQYCAPDFNIAPLVA